MAPQPPNPAAKRVVELVMSRLGISKATELAAVLEMPPYSDGAISLVRRWRRGEHGPSFDYTMAMLSKAGLLMPEADRVWKGEQADPATEARAASAAAEEARRRLGLAEPTRRERESR